MCDHFGSISHNVKEDLFLYGDSRYDENKNKVTLRATINYIKNTERFSGSLLLYYWLMSNFLPKIQTTQL